VSPGGPDAASESSCFLFALESWRGFFDDTGEEAATRHRTRTEQNVLRVILQLREILV
jgi:hypothetical protein